MSEYVYELTEYRGIVPKLARYELIRKNPKSATVKCFGLEKTIRETVNQKLFYSPKEAGKALLSCLTKEINRTSEYLEELKKAEKNLTYIDMLPGGFDFKGDPEL